jgi:hypothetical protein
MRQARQQAVILRRDDPLGVVATAFLTAIAKHAADDLYDAVKSPLNRPEITPLAKVSEALATAVEQAGPGAEIIVGLNIPERNWGTVLFIRDRSPEKIAVALARFTSKADELSSLMKAEVQAGRAPLGRATITFEEDNWVARWRSQKDSVACEIRIPDRGEIGKR